MIAIRSPSRVIATTIFAVFVFWTIRRTFWHSRVNLSALDVSEAIAPDIIEAIVALAPSDAPVPQTEVSSGPTHSCADNDLADRVVVVVRAGASAVLGKLPTQLNTILKCVRHLVVASDLEQEISGHHVYNVLTNVLASVRDTDPDFDDYNKLQQLEGQALAMVDEDVPTPSNSDKYMYFHMLLTAYNAHPDKNWYVFIETETYLVWPTLLQWLERLDATKKHIIGSVSSTSNHTTLHGNSGMVLSAAALKEIVVDRTDGIAIWDRRLSRYCFGDRAFSVFAEESELSLTGAWPMLGGDVPSLAPYGPTVWCQPVITLHGVSSAVMDAMWNLERQWSKDRPILYKDLYNHFLSDPFPTTKERWDNSCPGSSFFIKDIPGIETAGKSIESCAEACNSSSTCFQYLYRRGKCSLNSCFTWGKYPDPVRHVTSGWQTDRINQWIETQGDCEAIDWIEHSQDRPTGDFDFAAFQPEWCIL